MGLSLPSTVNHRQYARKLNEMSVAKARQAALDPKLRFKLDPSFRRACLAAAAFFVAGVRRGRAI